MIANQKVNAGSWYCVVEVDNDVIEQKLVNGEIKGFSLFSYANGASSYKDVPDTSDVHPLFISFVKYPANQVLFEVLDKEMYISKMEAVKMTDKDKSLLDKLKELLNSYDEKKVSDEKETEISKEETVDKKEVAEQEVPNPDVSELGEDPTKKEIKDKSVDDSVNAVAKEKTECEEVEKSEDKEESKEVKKSENKEESEEVKKEAGKKEETQEGIEKEEEVSNADILEAIIELVKAIKESKNDVKEEVVKSEDEEPETYIIKQATTKVDKKIEKGAEKKKYFDMLGRKL